MRKSPVVYSFDVGRLGDVCPGQRLDLKGLLPGAGDGAPGPAVGRLILMTLSVLHLLPLQQERALTSHEVYTDLKWTR